MRKHHKHHRLKKITIIKEIDLTNLQDRKEKLEKELNKKWTDKDYIEYGKLHRELDLEEIKSELNRINKQL